MPAELEAIIWCQACKVEKFELWRVPTESEGCWQNEARPPDKEAKLCQCGQRLERKPVPRP